MQWLHPVVICCGLTFWLVVAIYIYMVRVEHQGKKELEAATRVYITGAAAQYQRALVAEGRLSQCQAQF